MLSPRPPPEDKSGEHEQKGIDHPAVRDIATHGVEADRQNLDSQKLEGREWREARLDTGQRREDDPDRADQLAGAGEAHQSEGNVHRPGDPHAGHGLG